MPGGAALTGPTVIMRSPTGRGNQNLVGRVRRSRHPAFYCAGAIADTTPPVIVCSTCCLSIFTALSFPFTVGFSGALACTLPLAVS